MITEPNPFPGITTHILDENTVTGIPWSIPDFAYIDTTLNCGGLSLSFFDAETDLPLDSTVFIDTRADGLTILENRLESSLTLDNIDKLGQY